MRVASGSAGGYGASAGAASGCGIVSAGAASTTSVGTDFLYGDSFFARTVFLAAYFGGVFVTGFLAATLGLTGADFAAAFFGFTVALGCSIGVGASSIGAAAGIAGASVLPSSA